MTNDEFNEFLDEALHRVGNSDTTDALFTLSHLQAQLLFEIHVQLQELLKPKGNLSSKEK